MSPRNLLRFVQRVIGSLTVPDHMPPLPEGRRVLFSCHDVDRAMRDDQGRYSPILEGIRSTVEDLGYATVNLSHPYAVFRSHAIKGGAATVNYRSFLIRLRALLRTGAARAALRQELEIRLYRDLLQRVAPEMVVSIQPPPALCLAAKQLGIKVAEAMHGTNISLSDKVFCAHMAQPVGVLPDIILSFDDVSQKTVSSLCSGREILAFKTRDPWLHLLRRRQATERQEQPARRDGKTILVTLQWGYDGERDSLSNIIPNGILHPALESVFATTAGSGLRFQLRMHPIQVNAAGYRHHRRYIEALCERHPHLEWQHATSAPLPLLLDEASGHITMCSSSVGEALVAGVPSLLLCPTLHDGGANFGLFRELESSGLVRFGTLDSDDIRGWIDSCPARVPVERSTAGIDEAHQEEKRFYATLIDASAGIRPPPHASIGVTA
ncbi:hypothetical protein [Noviherbaspirillum aridicola]|uniref:Uncharacterized protein n=1 Tax=Noviherbaspirillum aridicola TaxID=2849687 RepID=A0ABQ4Q380_9BURK|nr:hypothetical protein [Noviherbaspirillum aridicola]GIZ51305.1 hypothetical protein NCCP691_13190 [Noviherbaspirillum aridicola]